MVEIVKRTTSVTEFLKEQDALVKQETYSTAIEANSKGFDRSENLAYLADPDHMIRRYFLDASPKQRILLRTIISREAKHYNSILKILDFSRQGDVKDAYDAGVDLLAEFDTLKLHDQAFQYLEAISHLVGQASSQKTIRRLEDSWEILVKGVSCAYKISAYERFKLISKISIGSQRRLVKTAVIDALVTIADDMVTMEDLQPIKNFIGRYTSEHESDSYVRDYAQEALEDLE